MTALLNRHKMAKRQQVEMKTTIFSLFYPISIIRFLLTFKLHTTQRVSIGAQPSILTFFSGKCQQPPLEFLYVVIVKIELEEKGGTTDQLL